MKRWHALALLVIVAVGIILRVAQLDAIPPGMTHDEADVGYHAAVVYETGERHIVDAPYGYIHQPFVQYSGALLMKLLGPTDLTQRLHSVFFGVMLIVVTYLWARDAFDVSIGLTAAAMVAVGFWPLMTSRFALNNQPVPTLFTLGLWLLWPTLVSRSHRQTPILKPLLAGLFFGLSVYPYEAGRVVLASLPFLGVYLFALERLKPQAEVDAAQVSMVQVATPNRSAWRVPFLIAFAVAVFVAAPHLLDPNSWRRTGTLVSETVGTGGAQSLVATVFEGLSTLVIKGDPFVTYNIPGRPIFDPILAVPFVLGLLIAIRKWRTPAYGYTLLWLAFGLAPTLVVGAFTSTIHSIAAQPPVFICLALGLVAIARFLSRIHSAAAPIFVAALIVFSGTVTALDYFERWGQSPQVRAAYNNTFASMIDKVNTRSDAHDVAISSLFPDVPLDPFIAARQLRRSDVTLRHFNAQRALAFPDSDSALLLIPDLAKLDPIFIKGLDLSIPESIASLDDDLMPAFGVYAWNPRIEFENLVSRATPLDANFGGALQLVGVQIEPAQVSRGDDVIVQTFWRIIDPQSLGAVDASLYDHTVVLFTHMVDENGVLVTQEDRLDFPASSWQQGDAFVQIHRLEVGGAVVAGTYRLLAGVYTQPAQTPLADTMFIGEVEVLP